MSGGHGIALNNSKKVMVVDASRVERNDPCLEGWNYDWHYFQLFFARDDICEEIRGRKDKCLKAKARVRFGEHWDYQGINAWGDAHLLLST